MEALPNTCGNIEGRLSTCYYSVEVEGVVGDRRPALSKRSAPLGATASCSLTIINTSIVPVMMYQDEQPSRTQTRPLDTGRKPTLLASAFLSTHCYKLVQDPRVAFNLTMADAQRPQHVKNLMCMLQRLGSLAMLPDISVRSTASKASRLRALVEQQVPLRG